MMPKSVIGLACVLACSVTSWAAEDFRRSYDLSLTREVRITNFLGAIKVTGHSGTAIEVFAHIEGTNKDSVAIIDRSHPPRIDIFSECPPWLKNPDTKVDFEVKVPDTAKDLPLWLQTNNGIIDVKGYSGYLSAKSRRGDITVNEVKGNVIANSEFGNVDVKLGKIGDRQLNFSSTSGSVKVLAPADFEAKVHMDSRMGMINTDFPIKITEGRYGGRSADGTLGAGGQMILMRSVWGSVSLMKQQHDSNARPPEP
jgi:hypothetical protein